MLFLLLEAIHTQQQQFCQEPRFLSASSKALTWVTTRKKNKKQEILAMASNLIPMASNLIAIASNLIAMASNLIAMASDRIAMASNLYNSDGLQPNSDGLPPTSQIGNKKCYEIMRRICRDALAS